ncbi:2-oxoglutarate and iron-dependent oxygenase domain-containing protein 3 [Leptodactylus fuscus]|uniref:2-oxoglutarate and iron-dependent oxygenase domain-containing protein 3 n=1 Tax=Leptodactylus fuscus TaxID=238119 RepID=UPI003F4E752B
MCGAPGDVLLSREDETDVEEEAAQRVECAEDLNLQIDRFVVEDAGSHSSTKYFRRWRSCTWSTVAAQDTAGLVKAGAAHCDLLSADLSAAAANPQNNPCAKAIELPTFCSQRKSVCTETPCLEMRRPVIGCTPLKCGRAVTDAVITQEEARSMRRIAEAGLSLGGSDGGASILDLHSGALSMGKNFVNMYRYYGEQMKEILTEDDFQLYRNVRRRIQQEIARTFDLDASALHLTKPTFFSRMNSSEAKTTHDEYWHPHIDKVTYGSFDYTSLLYLSDYSKDFGGGRFIFIDEKTNSTVEPKLGRLSFFTSGSENLHRVEKVSWGTRYAITISFTCNPDHSIVDPSWT